MLARKTLSSVAWGVHSGAGSGDGLHLSTKDSFWYAEGVKTSVSIVLFLLLSGFFLTALLGALEHSRRFLGLAGVLLVGIVCVIVFLTPVQLPPSLRLGFGGDDGNATTGTSTTTTSGAAVTSTVTSPPGFSITPSVTSTSVPSSVPSSAPSPVASPTTSVTSGNTGVSIYPVTSTVISPAVSATTTEVNGVRSP